MDAASLFDNLRDVASQFSSQRNERQKRTHLDRADFDQLHQAGYTQVALPVAQGGLWESGPASTRLICDALRILATGDSSVALVSAMHPSVLSYWLTAVEDAKTYEHWDSQCAWITESVKAGKWWGTITSEPRSGGDVNKTRTVATPAEGTLNYLLTGDKHFGSGSGAMDYMVTTAKVPGEEAPDWFVVETRDRDWDGTSGITLTGEWDGHGMIATQSHAFHFENLPATRIAWTNNLAEVSRKAGPLIGCWFTSVIVGIVDIAMQTAKEKLAGKPLGAYEQTEWLHAAKEHWLINQALEGMLRAVETQADPRIDVLTGKTAIAELSESILLRLCKIIGGGTFSRHSPFGFWFEDVRSLGFLRPPWNLAYAGLADAYKIE
ncbi:MAG: hypothetical protein COA78_05185 [Blastopirellula sp.]|nr:MAG: hypothetical protein COA78_05185 [Blastopirellula sp.]